MKKIASDDGHEKVLALSLSPEQRAKVCPIILNYQYFHTIIFNWTLGAYIMKIPNILSTNKIKIQTAMFIW